MELFKKSLAEVDSQIFELIEKERERQRNFLQLIPSESLASKAVLEALGSVLNNKYSEGYPGKRYYGGNEFIDEIENLAIERAKKLFKAEHANVQPYSGSPANIEIYYALLQPNDKVMSLSLALGGHLTHGHKVNFSGRNYNFVFYSLDKETEMLNYDQITELAEKERPKILLSGFTAYPREVDFKRFAKIAKDVGAYSFADISHTAGLIAAEQLISPLPEMDIVMTTTHKTLFGPRGAIILCKKELAQAIDRAVFPGMQGGPHNHAIAAKAVAFKIAMSDEFKDMAKRIIENAKALAEGLMDNGIRVVTNGTDTHMVLADVSSIGIDGAIAEEALDKAGITLNKNMIPFDKGTPMRPSGIRLGSPIITARGFSKDECYEISKMIAEVLKNYKDEAVIRKVREKVLAMCKEHEFYC